MDLDNLQQHAERLTSLLKDRQLNRGLFGTKTWDMALENCLNDIRFEIDGHLSCVLSVRNRCDRF